MRISKNKPQRAKSGTEKALLLTLLNNARLEVIPLNNVYPQVKFLAAGSSISVTASPAKGIDATLDLTELLLDEGHDPVPHIAARLVKSEAHFEEIIARLNCLNRHEIFLIGGDSPDSSGEFTDSVQLLSCLLNNQHQISHIGFGCYPDGHNQIGDAALSLALKQKEDLLRRSLIAGHASTQMCFNPKKVETWLKTERSSGFRLPVHLGIPGPVERNKLFAMGTRLGIGNSVRFLKKNRASMRRMITPGGYDPNELLEPLAPILQTLNIAGLHIFTFNQIEATCAWLKNSVANIEIEDTSN
jgi:methylenetetrahydrofolate reductase (NADPH)|tara:strand:+ start:50902 stop:51804 length:903 start_codon:yes stop_codon:yes gene_type:complete